MIVSTIGVRGSIPTAGSETSYYGGNTSCVTVLEDGWMLILDGGSGLRKVNLPDYSTKRIDILLTHLHMDHIQGLGFFMPLFDSSKEVHIWAPASATLSLQKRLNKYLSPPLFPISLRDLPCKLTLHEISNSNFHIGPFSVDSEYVIHPGPTVGFRVRGNNAVLAYIPDNEPALGRSGLIPDKRWISGFNLANQADLLLHDGQYTALEYEKRKGWGHSSIEDAIQLASFAQVKHLMLTHHDPSHTDLQLQELHFEILSGVKSPSKLEFAREGMEIDLS